LLRLSGIFPGLKSTRLLNRREKMQKPKQQKGRIGLWRGVDRGGRGWGAHGTKEKQSKSEKGKTFLLKKERCIENPFRGKIKGV